MSLEDTKIDELLARIGRQRGSGRGNSEEVWVVYYSRAISANNQCFIGKVEDILRLTDTAVKQLIEEKELEIDSKIVGGIKPLE